MDSPVAQLLSAVGQLDADRVMSLIAPRCAVMTADGRSADGADAVRALYEEFLGMLRSTSHRITAQWHQDDMWIAEAHVTYVLRDWLKLSDLPRAFFMRLGDGGIEELRVYGAHEHPLSEHRTGEGGMWIADHWIPPL